MAKEFLEFGEWLGMRVTYKKAAISIHRYLSFFVAIDSIWQKIPSYGDLVGHFGTAGLRKVLLPVQWMQETSRIIRDSELDKLDSEKRRIEAILDRAKSAPRTYETLLDYHRSLQDRKGEPRLSLRSIRLALTPAQAFLERAEVQEGLSHYQDVLAEYLADTPGQRASIGGFVKFLHATKGIQLSTMSGLSEKARANRRRRLELELLSILNSKDADTISMNEWLMPALAYFHGLESVVRSQIRIESSENLSVGITVIWNGSHYWIPSPLSAFEHFRGSSDSVE